MAQTIGALHVYMICRWVDGKRIFYSKETQAPITISMAVRDVKLHTFLHHLDVLEAKRKANVGITDTKSNKRFFATKITLTYKAAHYGRASTFKPYVRTKHPKDKKGNWKPGLRSKKRNAADVSEEGQEES